MLRAETIPAGAIRAAHAASPLAALTMPMVKSRPWIGRGHTIGYSAIYTPRLPHREITGAEKPPKSRRSPAKIPCYPAANSLFCRNRENLLFAVPFQKLAAIGIHSNSLLNISNPRTTPNQSIEKMLRAMCRTPPLAFTRSSLLLK
jgi:hypothetical protein